VDDFLPIDPRYDNDRNRLRPVFARSKNKGEIWVSLIEKAWAKLHGSYVLIESGSAELAFSHLTNAPT
jgi:hypothetical protein